MDRAKKIESLVTFLNGYRKIDVYGVKGLRSNTKDAPIHIKRLIAKPTEDRSFINGDVKIFWHIDIDVTDYSIERTGELGETELNLIPVIDRVTAELEIEDYANRYDLEQEGSEEAREFLDDIGVEDDDTAEFSFNVYIDSKEDDWRVLAINVDRVKGLNDISPRYVNIHVPEKVIEIDFEATS